MKLRELLEAVKDKSLTKEQIEDYHKDMIHMNTMLLFEIAELKKAEAFYLMDSKEETHAGRTRGWRVTEKGQRLIELEFYRRAVSKEVESLKTRIYAML